MGKIKCRQTKNSIDFHHEFIALSVLIIAILCVFYPVFSANYVNWDDPAYVFAEEHVTSFALTKLLTNSYVNHYHPVTMFSLALDWQLWQGKPFGFHFTNLLIHLINAVLVYFITKLVLTNQLISLGIALVFALHPVHVEPVAWISERKELLYTTFFLVGLWHYLKYPHKMWVTFGWYLLAVLAKATAVTFPIALLLVDWWNRSLSWQRFWEKKYFFLTSLIFAVYPMVMHKSTELAEKNITLSQYFVRIFNFYVFNVIKTFWPVKLSPFYSASAQYLTIVDYLLFVFLLLAISLVAYWVGKYFYAKALPWLLLFVVVLLPLSGLIPYIDEQVFADRYHYLPSIGVFIFLGLLVQNRWPDLSRVKIISIFCLIVLPLAFLSHKQTYVWQDSLILWQSAEKFFPESETVTFNLAATYLERNQLDKAIFYINQIEKHPNMPQNKLRLIYLKNLLNMRTKR